MAQYTIKHACGHSVTHQLYGKETERQRRIVRLAKGECPACYQSNRKPKAMVTAGSGDVMIRVDDAYPIKDSLKAAGYKWDGTAWMLAYKAAPKTREEGIAIARDLKVKVDALAVLSVEIELSDNVAKLIAALDTL